MKHILPLFIGISLLAVAAIGQPPPPGGVAASLIINEVDYDQPSTDTAEFVELYNFGPNPVLMNEVILALINGANGMSYDTIFFPAVTLGPGDYYVVCGDGGNVANCDQMEDQTSDLIQNGAPDAMVLYDIMDSVIIDRLSYEGDVIGMTEGTGVPANMGDNNDDHNVSLSRIPNGEDTDNNSADFVLTASTPGGANSPVSIAPIQKQPGFLIYPNPVRNSLNLYLTEIRKGSKIVVSNMIGKELINTVAESNEPKINTAVLPEGVYFVSVETPKGKLTKRFLKR